MYKLYPMIGSDGDSGVLITVAGGLLDPKTVLASFEIFRNLSRWLPELGV